MNIITVSREFGSGGREIGKRLADVLDIAYYDKEIISAIAERSGLDERYVESISEKWIRAYPLTFGRTFSLHTAVQNTNTKILVAQQQILKELADKGDCVIVGRCADVILRERDPFNLFIYANMASKIRRCHERALAEGKFSDHEIEKTIKRIDRERAKYRELFSDVKWDAKEGYHLCINTSDIEIKSLIPFVAEYTKIWFRRNS